ncbi:MAG: DHA2 family efflux MFS transporter permease subunit [Proteobacteria bacterium]|nr:DHA2 family efflux MFS transporter permease subunit [Pseudomonadota bacterium]
MSTEPQSPDGAPTAPRQRALIMVTVILASAMYSGDLSLVAIAIPHMQGAFSATPDEISWVATAFVLGSAAMIVTTGWLAARVGAKRLFLVSIASFATLSIMAAQATTLQEEILLRLGMGAVGAPIQPLCQMIVMNAYPREQHGRALATWSLGIMVSPILLLPASGFIVDMFGWSGVFYMTLPFGTLAFLGAIAFVPRTQPEASRGLDWLGLSLLITLFALLQFVLSRGGRLDWFDSSPIVGSLAISALCVYVLVLHLATARAPLIPPDLFRNRNFSFGLAATFVFGATNMTIIILLPLLQRNQLGYPVEFVGIIMAVRMLGSMLGQYIVSVLISRVDPRHLIAAGTLCAGTSTWIMAGWSLDVAPLQILLPIVLHGISGGSTWVCLNSLTASTLDARLRPHGIPIYFLTFNVGFSFGVAAILTYWSNSTQANYARLSEYVNLFNRALQAPFSGGGKDGVDPAATAQIASEITRQASMIAYNNTFVVVTVASLLVIPLAYLLKDPGWRRRR